MATKTFEELKQLAIQIRDEKTNKQNTATRIGTQMLEHLNKLEQDYYDKTATDEELKQRDEKLSELSSNTNFLSCCLNRKFITSSGTLGDNEESSVSPVFILNKNDIILGKFYQLFIYDSNRNFIEFIEPGGNIEHNVTITTENAAYGIAVFIGMPTLENLISINGDSAKIVYNANSFFEMKETISQLDGEKFNSYQVESSIYKKIDDICVQNLLMRDFDYVEGKYLDAQGMLRDNEKYAVSGYITLSSSNPTVILQRFSKSSGDFIEETGSASICYYDYRKQLIKSSTLKDSGGMAQWGQGICYVRFSIEFFSTVNVLIAYRESDKYPTFTELENVVSNKSIIDCSVSEEKTTFFVENIYREDDDDNEYGYFLSSSSGDKTENDNYMITGFYEIPIGGNLTLSINGIANTGGGLIVVYDKDKSPITGYPSNNTGGVATYIEGAAYARFSVNGYKAGKIQIERGTKVHEYQKPDAKYISLENLPVDKITGTLLGTNADTLTKDSLNNEETIVIDTFPMHIKKRIVMSFESTITTFNGIIIGKGYQQYRGDYVKIDTTNLTLLHYEQSESQLETVAHGITIEGFIKVAMYTDNSGYLYIIVQSKTGTFTYTFKKWGYEANYEPFVKSINSSLTQIKFNIGCQDFRCPVWAFGDSYFGIAANRWPGAIRDIGFFNFLIDGLAGQGSNGAYNDLLKCLQFGTPKYLLWCLGMNDLDDTFKTVFDKVKALCGQKGITLIAATIPTVPDRPREIISQYVRDSGVRYIDFYKAVGATSEGVWYDGYLDTDNVHPTELGAKVQAMQVLVDFPELMQYGLVSTDSEIGDTTGDH